MFGLLVGTLSLGGLVATVRHRRHHAFRHAFKHSFMHGEHRWGGRGWQRRGGRMRHPLHVLFAQLDTTPGQEKAIVAALEALPGRMSDTRKELDALCRELAVLIGGAVLNQAELDGVKARSDALYARFSTELRDLLALVHDVLGDEQRRKFAELINDGSLFHGFCEHSIESGHDHGHPYGFHHYGRAC